MGRIAAIVLSVLMLASLAPAPALANGDGYHRKSDRVLGRAWRGASCRCSPVRLRMFYSLAYNYDAAYYYSRGGIGRAYTTSAYSTDGYLRTYRD